MSEVWHKNIGYLQTPIGAIIRYYLCTTCLEQIDPNDNWMHDINARLKDTGLPVKEFIDTATIEPPKHKCRETLHT